MVEKEGVAGIVAAGGEGDGLEISKKKSIKERRGLEMHMEC